MHTWKYGISAAYSAPKTAPILLTGTICSCLREAASLGFDAIEYHMRENAAFDTKEINKVMAEANCKISMIVTGRLYTEGGFSLTSKDPDNEHRALEGMLRYVDMAASVGAGLVIGWAKGKVCDVSTREEYFNRLANNLRIIDEAAYEKGVPVVIECINHYEVDAFLTCHELVAFLRATNLKSCFVHLDTYHMMLEELDYSKAIHTAGSALGYMHFADSTRSYPGSGYLNFKEVFRALNDINYNGYLTIECFPGDNYRETAIKGLQTLKCIAGTIQ